MITEITEIQKKGFLFMNIYLTENSEITNFVWAKAEHWWPRVIPNTEKRLNG
jgi:hypothetical protein